MNKADISAMEVSELCAFVRELGEPAFRGKQLFSWIHQKNETDFGKMSNLPKGFREKLSECAKLSFVTLLDTRVSKEDGTVKFLFSMPDEETVESVLMRYQHGYAACISTQVGCKMGCAFCASTIGGMVRNLTAGEMLSQIYEMQRNIDGRIGSVVLMGSGEPLDNYENVLRFLRLVHDPLGQNLGQRHITLSTCGLIDQIYALMDENLQITLAVSLHAPNDQIRNRLMPVSRKYPMDRLLACCKEYADHTKRRITFEYALVRGVNDSADCARELSERLRHMLCHVNLIPVNEVRERGFQRSGDEAVKRFSSILSERGIETTVRRRLGSDINAACGQLRRAYHSKS